MSAILLSPFTSVTLLLASSHTHSFYGLFDWLISLVGKFGWLVSLVGQFVGWLVGWFGQFVGWLVGWLVFLFFFFFCGCCCFWVVAFGFCAVLVVAGVTGQTCADTLIFQLLLTVYSVPLVRLVCVCCLCVLKFSGDCCCRRNNSCAVYFCELDACFANSGLTR